VEGKWLVLYICSEGTNAKGTRLPAGKAGLPFFGKKMCPHGMAIHAGALFFFIPNLFLARKNSGGHSFQDYSDKQITWNLQ